MAWIESHQNLQRHPKTLRAAAKLEVSVPTLIGHLQCLWWWCLDFAEDGELTGFDHAEIAQAAMWFGDATAFVDALLQCGQANKPGFLEMNSGHLLVHDWSDYTGKLIERRQADAARKRAVRRTSAGHPQDIHTPSSVTVPNRTIHNRTGEPPSVVPPPSSSSPTWLQILLGLKGWPQDAAANVDVQEKTQADYGHLDLEAEAQKFVWYYQDSQKPTSARTARRDWWNWLKKVIPQVEPGRHPEEVDRKEYLRRYGKYASAPASDDAPEGQG
ncbi:MAG: hypothetical protein Q8P22_10780 [Chloroflexota bacterium]|nr:hypothetical protein [Chloroflexota bacterium]